MNKAKKLNEKNLSSIGVISINKRVYNWNEEKENGIVGKSIGVIVMANNNST